MQMYLLLITLVAIIFVLCAYSFSIKKHANSVKRRADEYMESYSELARALISNDHCCSTCLLKTTCQHSLSDTGDIWLACPMWIANATDGCTDHAETEQ